MSFIVREAWIDYKYLTIRRVSLHLRRITVCSIVENGAIEPHLVVCTVEEISFVLEDNVAECRAAAFAVTSGVADERAVANIHVGKVAHNSPVS